MIPLQEDKIWRSVVSSVIDGRMGGNIVGVNGWRLEVRNTLPSLLHHIALYDQAGFR